MGHAAGFEILQNAPLKPHTTFKIGGPARYFAAARSPEQVRAALDFARQEQAPVMVLGGGSNVLISDRGFDGLVLHPASKGVEQLGMESGCVRVRINAGESWDRTVAYTVEHGLWGMENLSHIPGQSGAALVQNIGAYGQQISDTFERAEILELSSGRTTQMSAEECDLGYRRSVFNTKLKGEFLILAIELKLKQRPSPNLIYADVKTWFERAGIPGPSQAQIREAIIAIRDGKFPYPREERGGNAGSFFKNPTLSAAEYRDLESRVSTRFGADTLGQLRERAGRSKHEGSVRLPAAFLVSICGLKGFVHGSAQVNPSQPLVILNLGGATADDVMTVARQVRRTVHRESGIKLDLEPELIGFSTEEIAHYSSLE
jgi:UDP-N-acetylmuramate dehydrogenase